MATGYATFMATDYAPFSNHLNQRIRARKIVDSDIDSVAKLLTIGFPRRSHQFWLTFLRRLANHSTPSGMPKYGFLMEHNGITVGVLLMVSSSIQGGNGHAIRCNVSSWYVEPAYRGYASLLSSQATSFKNVTYLNIDPAKNTHATLVAQGFSRYASGQFFAVPLLCSGSEHVEVIGPEAEPSCHFEPFERDLLLDHAKYGCTSFWCVSSDRAYPFVFVRRRIKKAIPCAQLVYCHSIDDLARFARPIGWFLALSKIPFVVIDANGPIRGLVGKYFDNLMPKYFKGPTCPRIGDLAYTETAMFGI